MKKSAKEKLQHSLIIKNQNPAYKTIAQQLQAKKKN